MHLTAANKTNKTNKIAKSNVVVITLEKLFVLSPVFWLFLVIFNVPNTKFVMSRLLVVVSLYCIFRFKRFTINLQKKAVRLFLLSTLPVVVYFAVLHLLWDFNIGFSRSVLPVVFYLLVLPREFLNKKTVLVVLLLAGCAAGISASYEYLVLNIRSGTAAINPIPFASYAAVLFFAIICLAKLCYQKNKGRLVLLPMVTITLLLTLAAIIFSMTRGVWVAVIMVALLGFILNIRVIVKHKIKMLVGFILLSTTLTLSHKTFQQGLQSTLSEIEQIVNGNKDTSIGLRLQLYQTGLRHTLEHPIFGISYAKDVSHSQQDLAQSKITDAAYAFLSVHHYHNQYIYLLVYSGVFGLLLFLVYLLGPIYILGKQGVEYRNLGIYTVSILLIAGLTDIPFFHTHITYLYTMLVGMIILMNAPEPEKSNKISEVNT